MLMERNRLYKKINENSMVGFTIILREELKKYLYYKKTFPKKITTLAITYPNQINFEKFRKCYRKARVVPAINGRY